ncbi:uncharacterized protein BYT42DRAFT_472203, partial [Radiomyces spectabilis]|uniref:uncharacterized protein n=1 Tax=Radiomyces spectabilis TaxID=64574 RepID=UPI00221FF71D
NVVSCCAQHCSAAQDDFKFQMSALQECLLENDLLIDLYSKYNCEGNWIERHWADDKRDVRANSSTSNCSGEGISGQPTSTFIRRYFKRCKRYIEAYNLGMDGWAADEEVKKFTHRTYTSRRRL